jgi:hypothetical protein
MQRRVRSALAVLAVQLLPGCGGGGEIVADVSSPAGTQLGARPPIASHAPAQSPEASRNLPPVFDSSGNGVVQDDTSISFYAASASDPEGAAVTFQISGGPDAGNFAIEPGYGELRFITPPNPGHPTDADGDNVYLLKISASDGVNRTIQDTRITVAWMKPAKPAN